MSEQSPTTFRIVIDCLVTVSDIVGLRSAQDFESLSTDGELSVALPPDVVWMLASTLAQQQILALNQSDNGLSFVTTAAVPRFARSDGSYEAVELPAYPPS